MWADSTAEIVRLGEGFKIVRTCVILESNPHIMHSTPGGMIARLTDQKLSMQDISSIPPLNNSQIHSNQPHSNNYQQPSSVQQYSHHQKPINVNPPAPPTNHRADNQMPEIRKYKKKFSSDINSASLWGVNLLIGTKSGLMLLDRQGQGKVYGLVEKRNFQQIEVVSFKDRVLSSENLETIKVRRNVREHHSLYISGGVYKCGANNIWQKE